MRYFYSLLAVVVLAVALTAPIQAAFTKISDLPAITSPSTNTWIEVADMAAATKSRKYLLTNLATVAQVPTLPTNMVVSSGPSLAGQAAVYTDTTGTNTAPSLLTITNGAVNEGNVYADVRVYGAIMDGSDDTAALQAAVDSGRIALVPVGTLTYTGTIAMKSGAGIVGQGIGVTILRKTGNGIGIKVDGTNNTTRLTDTLLSGFTLQGDNVAGAGDYGIVYHHVNDQHVIQNVEVRNCGDVGLFFKGDCFEIRGHNIQVVSNHGADQILFQETPDAGAEDANDITINDVYVLPAASTRAIHFTNACNGNIIGNLIIQSPAPEVEAISFDGASVKNNQLRGVFAYDQVATNGATAFVVFNNASENIIDGFSGGMTGIPVFDFRTNAVRNVIINSTKSASPTYTAKTDSGSVNNAVINWQGNNSTMLTPDSVASLIWTWNGYSSYPGTNTMGTLTITNWLSSQVGLIVNGFAGQTNDILKARSGGTNYARISSTGHLLPGVDGAYDFGSLTERWRNFYASAGYWAVDSGFYYWNGRSIMLSPSDGVIQLANTARTGFSGLRLGTDVAAPANVYIRPGDGSGTDKAGGSLTLSGGQSTGTNAGGSIIFSTSPAGGSSTNTANAGVTRLTIDSTGTSTFTGTISGTALSVTNMVFQKTRVIRQALTHAGGTITLNMATNVPGNATCTLTGAVTFASSNLIDGSQYDLIFFSSGASNSITWGPEFRFAGYKPGSIAATNSAGLATMGHLWAEASGTNLLCTYAEEQ